MDTFRFAETLFCMFTTNKKTIDQIPEKTTSLLLLLTLVLFLIIPILITFFTAYYKLIFAISYSFLIIIGSWSVSRKRHHLLLGLGLGLISFVLIWITTFSRQASNLELLKTMALFAFVSFLAVQLFKSLALPQEINISIIFSSISGYLLIGMIGGNLFQLLELGIPGSFNNLTQGDGLFDLHYLSFVTLSTLGYGDITPASTAAKSLSIIVSLAGQLYLTILIAILVGKFLSRKS